MGRTLTLRSPDPLFHLVQLFTRGRRIELFTCVTRTAAQMPSPQSLVPVSPSTFSLPLSPPLRLRIFCIPLMPSRPLYLYLLAVRALVYRFSPQHLRSSHIPRCWTTSHCLPRCASANATACFGRVRNNGRTPVPLHRSYSCSSTMPAYLALFLAARHISGRTSTRSTTYRRHHSCCSH